MPSQTCLEIHVLEDSPPQPHSKTLILYPHIDYVAENYLDLLVLLSPLKFWDDGHSTPICVVIGIKLLAGDELRALSARQELSELHLPDLILIFFKIHGTVYN